MNPNALQLDPLNSPHPVPWNWVMAMLSDRHTAPKIRYYRSPSLISPDGGYAAYSRIQMTLSPEMTQCHVGSVLFLENLKTGSLQTIAADSPLSGNPFIAESTLDPVVDQTLDATLLSLRQKVGRMPNLLPTDALTQNRVDSLDSALPAAGTIAILIPVGWSATGDRLLAREFEALFGSSVASDYAIVWDRRSNAASTLAPSQVDYSNAIVLGWSQIYPDRILFHAGMMGEPTWSVYGVDLDGTTQPAPYEQAIIFGEVVDHLWTGPQASMKSA